MRDDNKNLISKDNIWIISMGKPVDLQALMVCDGYHPGSASEYKISDLARYMLNPNQVEVNKKLVGCEIHYNKSALAKLTEKFRPVLPKKLYGSLLENYIPHEKLTTDLEYNICSLKDRNLRAHVENIYRQLATYDPIIKRLSKLNVSRISEIKGICEDVSDERSRLKLNGTLSEKIEYVKDNLAQNVKGTIAKACIGEGLFEMRGFDFKSFDHKKSHRLIKYMQNDETKAMVLSPDNKVEFVIEDMQLFNYMTLLELAIKKNASFNASLRQCMEGDATPLLIAINKKMNMGYSGANPPKVYKEIFESCRFAQADIDAVMESLKNKQSGVAFNYISQLNPSKKRFAACITVMHSVRALDHIKDIYPTLYSEIEKLSSLSSIGKLYSLDYIEG